MKFYYSIEKTTDLYKVVASDWSWTDAKLSAGKEMSIVRGGSLEVGQEFSKSDLMDRIEQKSMTIHQVGEGHEIN